MRSEPSKVNITVKKGADFHMVCKVRDPSTKLAVDITGSTIESDIYDTIGSGLFVASFVVEMSAPLEGEFFLHLPEAVTNDIEVDAGAFDVFINWPDNFRKLMFNGKVTFTPEQTDGL